MAKWRVPEVMREASCVNNRSQVVWTNTFGQIGGYSSAKLLAKAASNMRDLHAMCKTRVDVIVWRKRMYLRLSS